MKTILITGGAGYVGSQSLVHFQSLGWRVVVLDNLSTGHREFAKMADRFIEADLMDPSQVEAAIRAEPPDGILHCASKALVAESVAKPMVYFRHNITGAIHLIDAALSAGNIPIVFSSSAAVYGEPERIPIAEEAPKQPINPYGFTKLAIEKALDAVSRAHGLQSCSLRYFNAAGADPHGRVGERHTPESHLIPNIITAALRGNTQSFAIFGTDYPTRDGTCLRDFIHTLDIARGHARALKYLWDGGRTTAINLGSGSGQTVQEVFAAAQLCFEKEISCHPAPRRPGDPASLLANIDRAKQILGWTPQHSDMATILQHALDWHRS